jgi:GDSL-like Lipase/Acylhydrolase family
VAGARAGGVEMSLRSRLVVLVLAVTAVLGLTACEPPASYVALGDSYTAGPLITPQDPAIPGCIRSDANYPNLIAPDLDLPAFRDVSCSGAETEDMFATQEVDPDPDNPPQLNALDRNTKVVTLGIGGNDIGFSDIAKTCAELGIRNGLQGSPCKDFYTAGGTDRLAAEIASVGPKLEDVLVAIRQRSPAAKIFVVGYPAILPESTTLFAACQPVMPIAAGDVPYLRDKVEKRLNGVIKAVTRDLGHRFVDTYTPSIGHDACQPPGIRWVEPVVPAQDAAPVHPNRLGMIATADVVEARMRDAGVPVAS